jgi:polyhydroxybutyrate depolymerase
MKNKIVGIFVCLLLITTCVVPVMGELISLKKSSNDVNPLPSKTTHLEFIVAGKALRALRSYWLHIPPSYNGSEAIPLVIVLHGTQSYYSSNPLLFFRSCAMETYTEFSNKSDEAGFIVVYPIAKLLLYDPLCTPIFGDRQIYDFNFGWLPSLGWKFIDDIGFIHDLIDKMEQKYTINSSRIYITGLSAGAFMSYSIGAYLSDEVAAIAPVAGTIGGRTNKSEPYSYIPNPENPVSVIAFHGTADLNVPYDGSKFFVSVNTSISFWVEHNECNPSPEINTSASGKIIRSTYTNGDNGTEVVLYTIKGGPHYWPGNKFYDPIDEISATDLIWEFFAAHPKQ